MKTTKTIIYFVTFGTGLAALALGIGSACSRQTNSMPPGEGPPITQASNGNAGQPAAAPDWQLAGLDGKTVKLSDFKGKVVVLNFLGDLVSTLPQEIPELIALQKKYGNDLVVVGVSLDENGLAAVKSFVAKNGINYPVVMGDQKIASAYGGITAIPTTFVIDRAGKIAGHIEGGTDLAGFESAIKSTL